MSDTSNKAVKKSGGDVKAGSGTKKQYFPCDKTVKSLDRLVLHRSGVLCFVLISNDDQTYVVPREEANLLCPQLVINYYQSKLHWKSMSEHA